MTAAGSPVGQSPADPLGKIRHPEDESDILPNTKGKATGVCDL